jgi:hypothetical protein
MSSEILNSEDDAALARIRKLMHVGMAAETITVGTVTKDQFSRVAKYPGKRIIPLKNWITDFFEWLVQGASAYDS